MRMLDLDARTDRGLDAEVNFPSSTDDLWALVLAAPDAASRELASARFVDVVLARCPTSDVSCTGREVRC